MAIAAPVLVESKCAQNGGKRVAQCHWYFSYRALKSMAERVGFEPTVELPQHTLSKRAPSTTRTPLRDFAFSSLARPLPKPIAVCGVLCDVAHRKTTGPSRRQSAGRPDASAKRRVRQEPCSWPPVGR